MSKMSVSEPVPVEAVAIKLSLQEFCIRLSQTVLRPELIGAFEYEERTAGNTFGTDAEFRARFDAFLIKPV